MLKVEQSLTDIHGLQKELADIGVDIVLSDPVGENAVACIVIPDLDHVEEQYVLPDGGFYDGFTRQEVAFDEYRLRVIERLAQYYEGEAKSVADKWRELCGGEGTPFPDNLQARRKSLADTAERLCELIKGEPPELCAFDYSLLEKIARDPQARVTLDDANYGRLSRMGLVMRGYRFPGTVRCDGLTELGEKAMERYEDRSGIEDKPPMLDAGDYRILRKIKDRPQGSVTLRDADYERLSGMGLIERRHWYPDPASCDDILTELGLKAVERYEREDRR
ncbi:hypothetical protein [Bifidobacterium adolescentis]|uniref:hypothetical protein n=1 Tax=Bifidobacterium adolescentis TaxID=1680 RepID=UPI0018979A2B|nr:hypothetical protein [Bifidobacterium adolescentis]MDB1432846.1 hypothetical protein [Bifidobacterium adolescentis]MDB1544448.1 hypothetical protein [Bifidobacterium adolescentis]